MPISWDILYELGLGFLGLHPWELGSYTIKEFVIKLDYLTKKTKDETELLTKTEQIQWERARWVCANYANVMGAKLSSVYRIATFPWESPPERPKEDLLSKFPKTLN